MNNLSRLNSLTVYLSGPCENAADSGVSWRKELTPFLTELGLKVLDPTSKLFKMSFGRTEEDEFPHVKNLRNEGKFEELSKCMKEVVRVDLRMIDLSCLVVCQLDADQPTYGTIDELVVACSQKKPIYLCCKQGKKSIPLWLWGRIPYNHIYNNIEEIKEKLKTIAYCNDSELSNHIDKRWLFLNGAK